MMDDCILDRKPFGYITYDPDVDDIGGWTQPAKYGVLVEIEEYQESGSNIMINIISGRRFKSTGVIQPVLDNDVSGTHFPTVDELMEKSATNEQARALDACLGRLAAASGLLEQPLHQRNVPAKARRNQRRVAECTFFDPLRICDATVRDVVLHRPIVVSH